MTATGAELIATERERQIEELGYTAEHDSSHDDADLAFAAAVYAAPTNIYLLRVQEHASIHPDHGDGGRVEWVEPWPVAWERRKRATELEGRIRELVKAGALIAAEIDRLQAQGE
jgi:hypothetical protein